MRPDLNLAHVLVALEECRSLKGAAGSLGVSESTVRNALAMLRLQVGDPLFTARDGVLYPTRQGADLARRLRPAIKAVAAALVPVVAVPQLSGQYVTAI
ncbi:LysR family transcriptional regulator [uncultured Ramlibacter sp.]|uniref:helix-turn-helix domain-containing protein n=1 Tax=uncultured Ramlibacter sp. TaxID=260755 RepID=UPI00262060EE|nr:LysR family transcriptional regulator [uncultured Ramlibacter sp.]